VRGPGRHPVSDRDKVGRSAPGRFGNALSELQCRKPAGRKILRRMRRRLSKCLSELRLLQPCRGEILPGMRCTAASAGAVFGPTAGGSSQRGRWRAAPSDGAVLRPGWLDPNCRTARSRGMARDGRQPHTWLHSAAGAFYQNTPFFPILEMLKQLLGSDGSTPEQIAQQLPSRICIGRIPPRWN
jgi:hypothetical protein